jgi:hypothetical protein
MLARKVGFIFLISFVVFIFYDVCKKLFFCYVFFLFILYGQFLDFGGLSFQIKRSFFAFCFFLQILLSISFFYVFFSLTTFFWVFVTFDNLIFVFFTFLDFFFSFILVFQICNWIDNTYKILYK